MPITAIEEHDPALLSQLHAKCFDIAWSEASFSTLLHQEGVHAYAIYQSDALASFILYRNIADECEILTLCTHPDYQNQGMARHLLRYMLDQLKETKTQRIFLEFKEGNPAAYALYKQTGFNITGKRSAYYRNPGGPKTNAIMMEYVL